MSNSPSETPGSAGADQKMSALFASMVMQNTNMALIFLGQAPHPQTGQTAVDLEHATYFINQLEMLAVKTKGNLDKQEEAVYEESLTHLRMAFVEAFQNPPKTEAPAAAPSTPPSAPPVDERESQVNEPILPGEKTAESESRKKFSKKY